MYKGKKKLLEKRLRNKMIKGDVKKQIKNFISDRSKEKLRKLQSKMMKAVKKKVLKMKYMSRKIISLKNSML